MDTMSEREIDWEQEIRSLEEQGRIAFLEGDTDALHALWDDAFFVNSPLNMINEKAKVLELLGAGRIRHTSDVVDIEGVRRFGDIVVVMGRDTVEGPPDNMRVHRRFTNVWQRQDRAWKMIARHAQVVSREPMA